MQRWTPIAGCVGLEKGTHITYEDFEAKVAEILDILEIFFEKYEDGPDCYEDPDDSAGYLGKAVRLDSATFVKAYTILNDLRPVKIGGEENRPG